MSSFPLHHYPDTRVIEKRWRREPCTREKITHLGDAPMSFCFGTFR
jgi:hypothetical protein